MADVKSKDRAFYLILGSISAVYVLIVLALLLSNLAFTKAHTFFDMLQSPEIRYSISLSLVSATVSTILSLIVAVPIGYIVSRREFRGKLLLDSLLDIPIVLPPLVLGLSLLILFHTSAGQAFENVFETITGRRITFDIPGVILAQFMVACSFSVRTMRATFDEIPPRHEQVALTLGCTQAQAFLQVALPEARRGLIVAATLAWARSLGEFGPILVFAGATRMKTEVMPTTIFLEMSAGNLDNAVAISLLMILIAVVVLFLVRTLGAEQYIR